MTLPTENIDSIILYRIEKSDQAFREAKDNADLKHWSLAVNRLYYATFYLALAINMKDRDVARTHNGTYSLISKKYIATGILSTEEGNLYRQLFSMRQSGDYDDLFDWTGTDVIPMIPRVELLLSKMKSILDSK